MDLQLQVDVTEAAGLGEPAHVALTVTVPDARRDRSDRVLRQAGRGLLAALLHRGPAGPGLGRPGRLARRAGLGVRLGRPSRRGRELPARLRAADLHPGRGGESGRRSRGAAAARGGHPDRRVPEGRAPGDHRHRAVDGRQPDGGATGPLPLLRRHRRARLQRGAHPPAHRAGHAAAGDGVGAPRRRALRRRRHQRAGAGRARPGDGPGSRGHGLGLPLRRRRPRPGPARPRGLPRSRGATCRRGARAPCR